jgi:TRAP-type C4-dicarboxylate transport system permease small subunit
MEKKEEIPTANMSHHIMDVFHSFRKLVDNFTHLLALETQLALRSLLVLLVIVMLILIFIVSIWISLMGALVLAIAALGLKATYAFLIVSLINLLIIFPVILLAKSQLQNLSFKATRKHLFGSDHSSQEAKS